MNNELNQFRNKIKLILSLINKEYKNIIEQYNEHNLYIKSLPLKPSPKCSKAQTNKVNNKLEETFVPMLKTISSMIDDGIIELCNVQEPIKLSSILDSTKSINNLIYESWDRLYTFKYIKYNIIMSFIMQLYLTLERELNNLTRERTMFNSIKFLEKEHKISFSTNTKDNLNKYRHIINVYKHGYGESYLEIEKNYASILQFKLSKDSNYMVLLFGLNQINFVDLYNTILNLINLI